MSSVKWRQYCLGLNVLTHKQLEIHSSKISTLPLDTLVLNHQNIAIYSADRVFIALGRFNTLLWTP